MKNVIGIFAAVVLASSAFGSDPYAEERFKAKYGRYSAQEEARRNSLRTGAKVKQADVHSIAASCCDKLGSCPTKRTAATAQPSETFAETLFRAKFGRPSPAREARAAENLQIANHALDSSAMCNGTCCTQGE